MTGQRGVVSQFSILQFGVGRLATSAGVQPAGSSSSGTAVTGDGIEELSNGAVDSNGLGRRGGWIGDRASGARPTLMGAVEAQTRPTIDSRPWENVHRPGFTTAGHVSSD
jgi:hypothetical protein